MRFGIICLPDIKHLVIFINSILVLVSSTLEIVIAYKTLVKI